MPSPKKMFQEPRISRPKARKNLEAALQRALDRNDGSAADRIRAIMNGSDIRL